ncbi:MAG TPA: universal stress protein [Usitatibacter sp.]|nr:universal stress protein [Usitatibacter sp.]
MGDNVLVPMDGSEFALRALERAIAEAKSRGATIHLLRVIPPIDDYGMVPAYITREHRQLMVQRANDVLAEALRRVRRARVPCETHVLWGEIAPTIVRAARRLKCGSIVMGTRGRGATTMLLVGSVANKVVHLAKVPVTLVK